MIIIYYKIKDIPSDERPREKLKKYGVTNLTNKDLLAIILKTGTKNINVSDLALNILRMHKLSDFKDLTISVGASKELIDSWKNWANGEIDRLNKEFDEL